jgi:chemotaxis protein histidine kinase CheA
MKKRILVLIALCMSLMLTACGMTTEEIDAAITQLDTTYQAGTYDEAKTELDKLDKAYSKMTDEQKNKFGELRSSVEYAISSVQEITDGLNNAQSLYDQKMYYEAQQALDSLSQAYTLPPNEQKQFDEKQAAVKEAIQSWKVTETLQKAESQLSGGDYSAAAETLTSISSSTLTGEQTQLLTSLNEKISTAKAEAEAAAAKKQAEAAAAKKTASSQIDLQTAKSKVAQVSGYTYFELLSEANNKWYLAAIAEPNGTVRDSNGNVSKGVTIYSVNKSTGEVVREQ